MKKKLVAVAATVGMALGMTVVATPAALANDCRLGYYCGAVKNRTGKLMHYTIDLSDGQPVGCDVWNRNGGTTPNHWAAKCTHKQVTRLVTGGNGSGLDVDAYTFNYQGYHERHTRLGPWRWRQKGVWTKILTNEFADCSIGANNEIWCTMLVQK